MPKSTLQVIERVSDAEPLTILSEFVTPCTSKAQLLGWVAMKIPNVLGLSRLQQDRQGFVLIAVIWIVGLLAIISTAFILQVKSNTLLAHNLIFNGKAEAMADGMAELLAFRLSQLPDVSAMKPNGERQYCAWGDVAMVGYRIQDQAGLIDLNIASPQLMQKFLLGLGLSSSDATQMVGDMKDFRDVDHEAIGGGAEAALYAGRSFGPKNAPFESTSEIDQIPNANEVILKEFQEFTTVHSQAQGLDPLRTPEALRQILGFTKENNLPQELAGSQSPSPSKAFGIDIVVETREHARFYRRTIAAMVLQPQKPFVILSWEQGRSAESWVLPMGKQPQCFN